MKFANAIIVLVCLVGIESCGTNRRTAEAAGESRSETITPQFMTSLLTEPSHRQTAIADSIILSQGDTSSQRKTALQMYDFYSSAPIMGAEGIAVHLTDRWFADGTIKMRSPAELMQAKLYADLNRNSLIGAQAPNLTLYDTLGARVCVPGDYPGKVRILYFYDEGCPVCRLESRKMCSLADSIGDRSDIVLFTIYTGQNESLWKQYIHSHLPEQRSQLNIIHLWDPGMKSNFPLLYGVLSTPGIFLIGKDGKIAGRRLDTQSLGMLLENIDKRETFSEDEIKTLTDIVIGMSDNPKCSDVRRFIDNLCTRASEQQSERMFTSLVGALFCELRNRQQYIFKCGADYLAEKYIIGMADRWDRWTLEEAHLHRALFNLTPLGSKAPDIPLADMKGTLYGVESPLTVLFIYSENCERCRMAKPEIDSIESEYSQWVKVVHIDTDNYDVENLLIPYFDISLLPAILVLGEDKTVYAKYISAAELPSLIEQLISLSSQSEPFPVKPEAH